MLFFRAAARLFSPTRQSGKQVGGKASRWGHGEPPASLWPQRQATAPTCEPDCRVWAKKSSRPLNKAQAYFLRQVAKTNETMRAYFIHPLRCDEIIFWNLRVLRPVQFIFFALIHITGFGCLFCDEIDSADLILPCWPNCLRWFQWQPTILSEQTAEPCSSNQWTVRSSSWIVHSFALR